MLTEKYKEFLKLNFYQIYPKSFKDANNDGIGDFKGITEKIPYLAELGINGVWISPCFKSPNVDSGYDISDYLAVGEEFGTMEEFKEMLDTFHRYGIKVLVDLVVNHCSTEHVWFKEALKGKDNPYRDYFYWFDEKPNDWQSCFGGSAWQWEENSKQYYLHSFAVEQADLNWENPKVREEVKAIVDYWVDLGIDGFRCDVLDMISKDFEKGFNGNASRLHEFIHEIFGREKTKHLYTVGECWGTDEKSLLLLTADERGELTTSFLAGNINNHNERFTLFETLDYDAIHRHFTKYQTLSIKNGLVFVPFFENHDQCRSVSRFANDKELRYESATFFATVLYSLYGTPFILQGEELGTPDAAYSSIEDFDDVETTNYYKAKKGTMDENVLIEKLNRDTRDNGRRPMAWDNRVNGGFNDGAKPWLPVHSRVGEINLEEDRKREKSIFEYYKKIIHLRRNSQTLIYGNFVDLTGDRKDAFVFAREYEGERLVVVCNYDKESEIILPDNYERIIGNYPETKGKFKPFEAAIYQVK